MGPKWEIPRRGWFRRHEGVGYHGAEQARRQVRQPPRSKRVNWSDPELEAAVRVYIQMLDEQQAGRAFVKSDYNDLLRAQHLKTRTKAAVEYRMRNISAAMVAMGLPYVEGYLPAKNVGSNVLHRIQQVVRQQLPQ